MDFLRSYLGTNEPQPVKLFFYSFFGRISADADKNCSTGQRVICTKVTSYKINILACASSKTENPKQYSNHSRF